MARKSAGTKVIEPPAPNKGEVKLPSQMGWEEVTAIGAVAKLAKKATVPQQVSKPAAPEPDKHIHSNGYSGFCSCDAWQCPECKGWTSANVVFGADKSWRCDRRDTLVSNNHPGTHLGRV